MSDKKISELREIYKPEVQDFLPVANSTDTYKVMMLNLKKDTGWVDIEFEPNFIHADINNKPQYRKIENVVYLRGMLNIPSSNYQPSNPDASGITTNTDLLYVNDYCIYFRKNGINLPETASPLESFEKRHICVSRRYSVQSGNDNYFIPITAVVTLVIHYSGIIQLLPLRAEEYDMAQSECLVGSHPLRELSTVINQNQPFPDYRQLNVGASANNNAISLPAFNTVTVPENIDTTKGTSLGGFAIRLDGISYIGEGDKTQTA